MATQLPQKVDAITRLWKTSKSQDAISQTTTMTSGKSDQAEGKLHEVKGKLKEALGNVSNDSELETEGKDETTSGTIKEVFGK